MKARLPAPGDIIETNYATGGVVRCVNYHPEDHTYSVTYTRPPSPRLYWINNVRLDGDTIRAGGADTIKITGQTTANFQPSML